MRYHFVFVFVFLMTFGLKIPLQRLSNPARRLGTIGNTALNNYQNVLFPQVQYYANITVGTPGQTFSALFDTGSSLSWVPSITCEGTCYAPANYNSTKSSSYKPLGISEDIEYQVGSAEGVIGMETFAIGTNATITATNVPFLLVTTETDISYSHFAGLIVTPIQGFAFSALNHDYPTFVDMLKSQNVISDRVFSFYLSNNNFSDNAFDTESVCVIGEVDLSYAKDPVHYIPLYKQQGYWSVQLSSMSVGIHAVSLSVDIAILDTGTSLLVAPQNDFTSLMNALDAAGSCSIGPFGDATCDCHKSYKLSSYPDLVISLNQGANNYTFAPSDYFKDVRDRQDGELCIVLITGGIDYPFWILGDVFLRKYYTIFDMDNARVGISSKSLGNTLVYALILIITSILG